MLDFLEMMAFELNPEGLRQAVRQRREVKDEAFQGEEIILKTWRPGIVPCLGGIMNT